MINSLMFCGLALKRIKLPQSIFYSQDYCTLFTPKNTLVIVTEILLCIFNIPIYVYIQYSLLAYCYRKEIRF